jgi:predicted Zn finger-like uncharacterized protein
MKIACDTCGTKYSIDDSRIAGRSFKIRCKQCAHVILLPDARAALADTLPAAGEWYVVADSTPRPVTLDELRRLHALGKIDDRSLVWREGFIDWCELGLVDELHAAQPCTVETARDPGLSPAAQGAQGTAPPTLRNQRNESSVLFTLGNLARFAAPRPAVSAASGVEGSGLLDIRSLARTLAAGRTERSAAADVPVFGEVTFGDPAVLLPQPPPRRDRRLVWALAAAIGALVIVAMVLVVIATRDRAGVPAAMVPQGTPAAPTAAPAPPAPPAPPAAPAVPATPGEQPTPPMSTAALAVPPTVPPAPPGLAIAPPVHAVVAGSRRAAARTSSSPPIATRPASPPAPSAPAESCSEVTCIINGYADRCCEMYRVPDSLDRAAVAAGLTRIDTSACRNRSSAHGDVAVSVRVSPAGSVTAVTVRSSPDPELSACVVAAAREGTFARTQRGGSFAYAWRF